MCLHTGIVSERNFNVCSVSFMDPYVCVCVWMYYCRYTAVAMPMLYNTRYSSRRRVAVMIAVVWFLSFAISCPLLFGLNNTGNGYICPPSSYITFHMLV